MLKILLLITLTCSKKMNECLLIIYLYETEWENIKCTFNAFFYIVQAENGYSGIYMLSRFLLVRSLFAWFRTLLSWSTTEWRQHAWFLMLGFEGRFITIQCRPVKDTSSTHIDRSLNTIQTPQVYLIFTQQINNIKQWQIVLCRTPISQIINT